MQNNGKNEEGLGERDEIQETARRPHQGSGERESKAANKARVWWMNVSRKLMENRGDASIAFKHYHLLCRLAL